MFKETDPKDKNLRSKKTKFLSFGDSDINLSVSAAIKVFKLNNVMNHVILKTEYKYFQWRNRK